LVAFFLFLSLSVVTSQQEVLKPLALRGETTVAQSARLQSYPDISGSWANHQVQIAQSGQSFEGVWANGRPTATGSFTSASPPTISVNFPDDRIYSGAIVSADGNTITWSGSNIWTKDVTYPDISGSWANHQVQITQSGQSLQVVWANGRPTATGSFTSASPPTISVNFPDDRIYSGAIVSADGKTITWSASNTWTKDVVTYPDISGSWANHQVQIAQSGQNFEVVWANGRPTATGSFTSSSPPTISVNFPDDQIYSGAIVSADGNTITYSASNIWTKDATYPDISGSWANHQVQITQSGQNLQVVWASGRPTATGSFTSSSPPTISVNFPDDRIYSGAIVSADGKTITWSASNTWTKDP